MSGSAEEIPRALIQFADAGSQAVEILRMHAGALSTDYERRLATLAREIERAVDGAFLFLEEN